MFQNTPSKIDTTRRIVVAAGAAALVGMRASRTWAAGSEPIRLGILNTFTGPQAYSGIAALAGLETYFDRLDWTVAGRKIELIKEDDQFNPQIGLEKAKKFVERDKVAMIVGPQGSAVALALLNYVVPTKTFLVVSGAGTDALTRSPHPYVFRTSISTWQLSQPVAKWVYDNLAKEVVVTTADYAGGRDTIAAFVKPFTALGGKIVKEIYPPLGTTDYSPYLTDLKSLNVRATYNFYPGSETVRFVQQYVQYGLMEQTTLTGFELMDEDALAAVGDAALGLVTATPYTAELDNPINKRFVADYMAKTKRRPDHFADYGYTVAAVIDRTLQATGGDTDKDKLSKAMAAVTFDAARGPFRFDQQTHNPIENVYMCKVEKNGGILVNRSVATYRDVRAPAD